MRVVQGNITGKIWLHIIFPKNVIYKALSQYYRCCSHKLKHICLVACHTGLTVKTLPYCMQWKQYAGLGGTIGCCWFITGTLTGHTTLYWELGDSDGWFVNPLVLPQYRCEVWGVNLPISRTGLASGHPGVTVSLPQHPPVQGADGAGSARNLELVGLASKPPPIWLNSSARFLLSRGHYWWMDESLLGGRTTGLKYVL